jgi:hypothetical protein
MRDWIQTQIFGPELKAVLLVSLMEAADRVDSTTGVQMAYLKGWASRSYNDIELRLPNVLPRASCGKGRALQREAQDAARHLTGDVGYLDPPYNQHKYLGNYHIWETLVRWDAPEAYGIARKRIDCRERRSAFNSKPNIQAAMAAVIDSLDVRHLVVSFNNEGYIQRDEMIDLLSRRGEVFVIERDFKRYVGAQIGVYNPSGLKVGAVSHLSNKEYIFVVPDKAHRARFKRHAGLFERSLAPSTSSSPAPRRSPPDDLHDKLTAALEGNHSMSSQEAQREVGGTAADLRPIFQLLLEKNLIHKTGKRRGTVYHWGPNGSQHEVSL